MNTELITLTFFFLFYHPDIFKAVSLKQLNILVKHQLG